MRRAVPLPTPWFAAAVAATAVALFAWPGRNWLLLLVIEAALVAVFVVDALACTSPAAIGVARDAPGAMRVGDEAELSWLVENRATRRAAVTVSDALWPSLQPRRRSVQLTLEPSARVRVRTALRPARRGRFPLGDVTVRVHGPMRMAIRQSSRAVDDAIRVMPAYPSRDDVWRRTRAPRVPDVGTRSIRNPGGGTEFDQLREYRPDDEFRRIDWPSTVRLQRPIVKQYRTERNQTVVALLDNGRMMAASVAGVPRVEHGMDAVLGMTDACVHVGDRVGLVCFDRQVRTVVPPRSGQGQLRRVAEAMYLLDPDLAESAYVAAFGLASARFRRRSLYVVLTDLAEATVEHSLVPALSILVRRHLVVVGCVSDPEVERWAHPTAQVPVRAPVDAFRSAAAVAALQQRERAAARLRAAGAIVVDSAPGRLAVDLVDTYLRLKATGRL